MKKGHATKGAFGKPRNRIYRISALHAELRRHMANARFQIALTGDTTHETERDISRVTKRLELENART